MGGPCFHGNAKYILIVEIYFIYFRNYRQEAGSLQDIPHNAVMNAGKRHECAFEERIHE
jgi:hypothetical protein